MVCSFTCPLRRSLQCFLCSFNFIESGSLVFHLPFPLEALHLSSHTDKHVLVFYILFFPPLSPVGYFICELRYSPSFILFFFCHFSCSLFRDKGRGRPRGKRKKKNVTRCSYKKGPDDYGRKADQFRLERRLDAPLSSCSSTVVVAVPHIIYSVFQSHSLPNS